MTRTLPVLFVVAFLGACAGAPAAPPAPVADLAPSGTLRAVINYGNPILAKKDAVGRALKRASRRAPETARMHGTPLYFCKNGKVVALKP